MRERCVLARAKIRLPGAERGKRPTRGRGTTRRAVGAKGMARIPPLPGPWRRPPFPRRAQVALSRAIGLRSDCDRKDWPHRANLGSYPDARRCEPPDSRAAKQLSPPRVGTLMVRYGRAGLPPIGLESRGAGTPDDRAPIAARQPPGPRPTADHAAQAPHLIGGAASLPCKPRPDLDVGLAVPIECRCPKPPIARARLCSRRARRNASAPCGVAASAWLAGCGASPRWARCRRTRRRPGFASRCSCSRRV